VLSVKGLSEESSGSGIGVYLFEKCCVENAPGDQLATLLFVTGLLIIIKAGISTISPEAASLHFAIVKWVYNLQGTLYHLLVL